MAMLEKPCSPAERAGNREKKNIVLIGMPGAGKSTLGVVLAKIAGMKFLDVDLVIQDKAGKTLQTLINERGAEGFIALENEILSGIQEEKTVIATGGSAVYSDEGMRHLGETGTIVYLRVPFETLARHLGDLDERGVVMRDPSVASLRALYDERTPLYQRYADVTVDVGGLSITQAARKLAAVVRTCDERPLGI